MFSCIPICEWFELMKSKQESLSELALGSDKLHQPFIIAKTAGELVLSSKCYNRNLHWQHSENYSVSIRLIPPQTYFSIFEIIQWQNRAEVHLGNIQIISSNNQIWVRWFERQNYIRQFDVYELKTLLNLFEKASQPLAPEILVDFGQKQKRSQCYNQNRYGIP